MSGILFIDAEQPFSDQTTGALRSRGFEVKQMDDGKDGLDWAAKSRPDLIVLCVELPKMSGYSICNKLKKDNDLRGIPLIITSKEATPETFAQHKKLKTRAEDYLIKPFSDADLVDKIGALIALPAAGGARAAVDDGLDALESLGDLDLGGSAASGDEGEIRLGSDDLASLDLPGDPPMSAPASSMDMLGDLDSGIDGLTGQREGLDDLDMPGSIKDDGLAGLDDALDSLSVEPAAQAPAAPAPAPAPPAPAPRAPPPVARPAVTVPPSSASSGSNADLQALQTARRETSDLKAKIGELEARLKQAEDRAAAASTSTAPTSASSAREVLTLKQQLRAKDDEILQKEQALVEVQEQLEQQELANQTKLADAGRKDVEISSLKARVEAISDERDALEQQVQGRLQQAESEVTQLRAALEQTQQQAQADVADANMRADESHRQIDEAKKLADKARADAAARIRTLETELKEKEQDAVKAYQRLKSEEQLRMKAREAAELAVKLLKGDVDMKGAELEL